LKHIWTILIFSLLQGGVCGQDLQQTLELAEHYHSKGDYGAAVAHYSRVLFFDSEDQFPTVHSKLADCYFMSTEYGNAYYEYGLAFNLETSDSARNGLVLKRALILIILNDIQGAMQEIYSLNDSMAPTYDRQRNFLLGLIHVENAEYAEAERLMFISAAKDDSLSKEAIKMSFGDFRPGKPNAKTMKVLSYIFPGLGQLCMGDFKGAINSLVLTGAMLSLAIYSGVQYSWIDGFMSVMPFFQRYYLGGAMVAEKNALEKQRLEKNRLVSKLIEIHYNSNKCIN
jgi:tetratricopeptide (TPR) repeat protein